MVGRASLVLTTGEVAGAAMKLANAHNAQVTVDLDFTIGSLTNVIARFYASMDGTTYDLIYDSGNATSLTLTGSDTVAVPMPSLAGYKFFRASVQGTGTVTSSLCAFNYRWLRKGSQI
jgi:hypothetical protein